MLDSKEGALSSLIYKRGQLLPGREYALLMSKVKENISRKQV